jgi:hypothetical protein
LEAKINRITFILRRDDEAIKQPIPNPPNRNPKIPKKKPYQQLEEVSILLI